MLNRGFFYLSCFLENHRNWICTSIDSHVAHNATYQHPLSFLSLLFSLHLDTETSLAPMSSLGVISNGVARSQSDPLRNWSILLSGLCKLLLGSEGFVWLFPFLVRLICIMWVSLPAYWLSQQIVVLLKWLQIKEVVDIDAHRFWVLTWVKALVQKKVEVPRHTIVLSRTNDPMKSLSLTRV